MSIYVTGEADLIALVNTASGITFTPGELIFTTPQSTTVGEETQWGKNTKIGVTVSATSTKAKGSEILYYDRLDLSALELMNVYGVTISSGQALSQWLPPLIGYLNIPFTTDDLVDHATTTDGSDVVLLLEAKSGSLGWVGDATLRFVGVPDISTAFANNQLPGF